MPLPARLAALLLAVLPVVAGAQEAGLEVAGARAVAPREGAPMGAAYMTIRNGGEAPDRLLSAESPAARTVELHRSVEGEGGVVGMEAVEGGLPVPAGGELLLEPGGVHVMLIGLAPGFAEGATIPLTLRFEGAGEVTVEAPVEIGVGGGRGAGQGEGHGG